MVSSNISSIETLDELQRFVYRTLCNDHELLLNDFPTSEKILRKPNGHSCGMMFCLYGPRKTELTAIWEKDQNRVLFYGVNGQRYQQIHLDDCHITDVELH
ncbi:MAG: hypothetical protein Q4C95_07515 [Planctomycetia bacterium]|nr:hypothetical protein [Planctomycetia bacterium]